MILSHPNKSLKEHTNGVLSKFRKNCNLSIGELAVKFHDLGKINPNFQKKVRGEKTMGYSNHSYLSVIVFYSFLLSNELLGRELIGAKDKLDFQKKIWQIISIIAHHHGNLPDFSNILNEEELIRAGNFIETNEVAASDFIEKELGIKHKCFKSSFNLKLIKSLTRFDEIIHGKIWQANPLENFLETQFAFASLLEADKRDAGNNAFYLNEEKIENATQNLINQLSLKFNEIESSENPTELNRQRNAIRNEAVITVREGLLKGKRVFSLPAPTGAGKTFTLLAIAQEIIKTGNKLGIIYALPFLSITDQVENILESIKIDCLPVTSKSENELLEKAQIEYEDNPTQENLDFLLKQSFSENTFDHPFILTTFVQFFETLVSNKNSTLLKLPNLCNKIFLIDEIQALSPRLYIFFTALLDAFCKNHNSYAVISTGTMPKFDLPNKTLFEKQTIDPSSVFRNYSSDDIFEVINPEKYFSMSVFNRYRINWIGGEEYNFEELIKHIGTQSASCLVILNTIADTKYLFNKLWDGTENIILINTHFTVADRLKKIGNVKQKLRNGEKIILISTQLIEAGVDLDFPIVYRDLCPLPSLIQSAGRCNRNKFQEFGQVYLFQLKNEEGKISSKLVYRKEAKQFLDFCKSEINKETYEKDLFEIQSRFFEKIKNELTIGEFTHSIDKWGNEYCYNFIECINTASFEKMGRFKLITESTFGLTYQYFIPIDKDDNRYELLVELMNQSLYADSLDKKIYYKIKIQSALKSISNRLITVRINNKFTAPAFSNTEEYFGIRVLSDLEKYSKITGIELEFENCIL